MALLHSSAAPGARPEEPTGRFIHESSFTKMTDKAYNINIIPLCIMRDVFFFFFWPFKDSSFCSLVQSVLVPGGLEHNAQQKEFDCWNVFFFLDLRKRTNQSQSV